MNQPCNKILLSNWDEKYCIDHGTRVMPDEIGKLEQFDAFNAMMKQGR